MLRRALALSMMLFLSVAFLGCQKDPPPTVGKPGEMQPVTAQEVEAPQTSGNLTVWLIKGADQSNGRTYLTLAEAMEQKKLVVHETGNVNQLAVENVSDDVVFIPAGSIVKGGRQDRTLGTDLIITKKDGKLPIDAFCVEHGRWSQRGSEHAGVFAENTAMVSGKAMKVAANSNAAGGNQGEVWNEVAKAQDALEVAASRPEGNTSSATLVMGGQVVNAASPSSFQLTMESEGVQKLTAEHRAALLSKAQGRKDVVGYVYAINNQIAGGNVYASPELFQKLWPMLLDSAIVEAVTERAAATQPAAMDRKAPTRDAVATAMKEQGKAKQREVNGRTQVNTYDAKDSMLLETRDTESGAAVARQLLIKPDPAQTPARAPIQQEALPNLPELQTIPQRPQEQQTPQMNAPD